jgi:chromosome segregation ATPase
VVDLFTELVEKDL